MHDANGNELKVGDKVIIPAEVTVLHGFEDFCNVNVQTALGRRPDGTVEHIYSINTAVLVKVPDDVDFSLLPRKELPAASQAETKVAEDATKAVDGETKAAE